MSRYSDPVPESLEEQLDRAVYNFKYWLLKVREIRAHIKLRKEHNELYDRYQELLEMETRRMLQMDITMQETAPEIPMDVREYQENRGHWIYDQMKPKEKDR